MNKSTLWGIIGLLIVLIGVAIAFNTRNAQPSLREEIIEQEEQRPEITLNVKHQYKDGEHAFVGTLELPTPCHGYNAEVIPKDTPEIKLTTTDPQGDMMCAQVVTEKDFKVTYASDNPDLEFSATLNGAPVTLNVFEVGPDDDIDTLELFLKG